MLQIKNIYSPADKTDGLRILVDRLWPRGLSKERARVDLWLKDIAPSHELRKWFKHEPEKWDEFKKKYEKELTEKNKFINLILEEEKKRKTITLLYAAKDAEHNNAVVLKNFLLNLTR